MKGLLADINVQGYIDVLVAQMQAEPWKLFWEHLHLNYFHFADVGLVPEALDSHVWETCQREELVLITDNRNKYDAGLRALAGAIPQLREVLQELGRGLEEPADGIARFGK